MERAWIDAESKETLTDQQLYEWVKILMKNPLENFQLIVGTDSHSQGREYRFVTSVVLYNPGKGGNFYRTHSYELRSKYRGNQKLRIFREVELSLELAQEIFENTGCFPSEIHIDASQPGEKEFTSQFSEQLTGYVTSSGFVPKLKPESYAASTVSDRYSK